ncbi:MAG: NYN domain-containing protein [Janthinobacterium lividum]
MSNNSDTNTPLRCSRTSVETRTCPSGLGNFVTNKSSERCALFIDGANLYAASRNLGFDIDYRSLLQVFTNRFYMVRAYYYSALLDTEEYSPLKPLTDWLAYNGFTLVTKTAREFTDHQGRRRIKGNMDVELAVDMMELAPTLDHVVLFSGDSDFRRLVEAVQRRGVRVTVVSSVRTQPPMVADELRRQADVFIELADIAPEFTRRVMDRPTRPGYRADETSGGSDDD